MRRPRNAIRVGVHISASQADQYFLTTISG
jgi:hypothetical protein